MFNSQDNPIDKGLEDFVTMAEGNEHQNTEEQISTQELLNIMVATQIQLREDINLMVQQFQNMKNDQEKEKTNQTSPIIEHEKMINEKMSKMEEMIERSRRLDDLIDYQSLSLFPDVRLSPKFKMPVLDKFNGTSCPKSHLKMYIRAMQPLGAIEEMLAQMFQNALTGAVLRWFVNGEDTKLRFGRRYARSSTINTSTT